MSLRVSMQESKLKPVCLASRLNSLHLKWVKRICKPTGCQNGSADVVLGRPPNETHLRVGCETGLSFLGTDLVNVFNRWC